MLAPQSHTNLGRDGIYHDAPKRDRKASEVRYRVRQRLRMPLQPRPDLFGPQRKPTAARHVRKAVSKKLRSLRRAPIQMPYVDRNIREPVVELMIAAG